MICTGELNVLSQVRKRSDRRRCVLRAMRPSNQCRYRRKSTSRKDIGIKSCPRRAFGNDRLTHFTLLRWKRWRGRRGHFRAADSGSSRGRWRIQEAFALIVSFHCSVPQAVL
jgi:hypothetical protein